MHREGDNTPYWYHHPEYIDDLDPPDSGTGNQIMFWFGFYLDEWIWDYVNVELWYLVLFPDSQKRILTTHLLIKARRQVFHSMNLLRSILLSWGVVCPLLDKMNTWFFHRSSSPAIIYLFMILVKIVLLF